MTVILLRPNTKQPSPKQRLRRRVFARLDSHIIASGCSLTIEGIARSVHPSQWRKLYRLVPLLRDKSPVETLTTLLLQAQWWRIEAPDSAVLTAADLDPIVADWIVRFEARQRAGEELYGAVWHAYQTLSESQRIKLGERSDASA